jgi:hypothetical protein
VFNRTTGLPGTFAKKSAASLEPRPVYAREFNAGSSGVRKTIGLRDTFAEESAGKADWDFPRDFPGILHPFRYPPRDTLR